MNSPTALNNPAAAIPVWIASPPLGGVGNGISSNSSVGTASAMIIPAGTYSSWVTIQNTHASQSLSISFNSAAIATDLKIVAGQAFTLPFGFANALSAIGSGAATTFALIGI